MKLHLLIDIGLIITALSFVLILRIKGNGAKILKKESIKYSLLRK